MVFLRSIHSAAEEIRSSFYDFAPVDGVDFTIEVDEPVGGPVVIRISGQIERSTSSVVAECLGEGLLSGSPIVMDFLEVTRVDTSGLAVLADIATRLCSSRARAAVVCTEALRSELAGARIDLLCHDALSPAIAAVMGRQGPPCGAPADSAQTRSAVSLTGTRDALHGTYL